MRTNPDSPTRAPSGRIIWAVIALILLPLIPIAVGINFLGISDRLDHIPGISKGGGLTSAVVALVVVGVIFGVAVGGIGMFAGGDDGPAINATSTPTPEPTDMPVPTATPSPTPLTTPTATPTPSTAELQADYLALKENYFQEFPEPDDTTPEILGADVHDDELWVVFDETDVFENGTRMRLEWTTITNGYLHALDDHHGHTTERMRAVGWNDTGPITTFSVTTEDALDHINGNTTYETYYQNWFRTVRATTDEERRIARETADHTPRD